MPVPCVPPPPILVERLTGCRSSQILSKPRSMGMEATGLIELTQAHKVSLEPWGEVDVGQLAVLASLVDEGHGGVSEPAPDGPHDVCIFALYIFFYSNLRPCVVRSAL